MNQKTPERIKQIQVLSKSLKPEGFSANFVAKKPKKETGNRWSMMCQSLNIFIFQLSLSKLSSVLADLSAFKSGKFSVCFYLALDSATVLSVEFLY